MVLTNATCAGGSEFDESLSEKPEPIAPYQEHTWHLLIQIIQVSRFYPRMIL